MQLLLYAVHMQFHLLIKYRNPLKSLVSQDVVRQNIQNSELLL